MLTLHKNSRLHNNVPLSEYNMQNSYMEVGRGSTRGRRRGPMGPTASLDMERRLAVTWEGNRGASHSDTEYTVAFEMVSRRAITWEGVQSTPTQIAADKPAKATVSQVGIAFKESPNIVK